MGTTSFSENSSAVEKAQQEVHGFYFQDERGPGKFRTIWFSYFGQMVGC